jgi:hypothetical protein
MTAVFAVVFALFIFGTVILAVLIVRSAVRRDRARNQHRSGTTTASPIDTTVPGRPHRVQP